MRFMHMADVHLGACPDGRADWSENSKKKKSGTRSATALRMQERNR